MKEKLIKATESIFAYGMTILMTVTFLAGVAYFVALIAGQPLSMSIHAVVSQYIFLPVYVTGILLAFDGILNLYLRGELLFRLELGDKHKKHKE